MRKEIDVKFVEEYFPTNPDTRYKNDATEYFELACINACGRRYEFRELKAADPHSRLSFEPRYGL